MTNNREHSELDDVLHSLDHQKWEAIGVEALAKEAAQTISLIMVCSKLQNTSLAQDMATVWALKELMQLQLCDDCVQLATRIKDQIVKDFQEWKLQKQEHK